MKTTYIDLKLLDKITITKKKESKLKWFDEIPETYERFLGIKCLRTKGTPEGWGDYRHSTESLLKNFPNYEVDEENEVVYERPRVVLNLINGQWYEQYFDTDEDAEEYAYDVNQDSGKNLYVINHN
jgi:hypothetical protein